VDGRGAVQHTTRAPGAVRGEDDAPGDGRWAMEAERMRVADAMAAGLSMNQPARIVSKGGGALGDYDLTCEALTFFCGRWRSRGD
jgi:hypothetical protein